MPLDMLRLGFTTIRTPQKPINNKAVLITVIFSFNSNAAKKYEAIGAKNNARVNLKIIEPEGSERPRPASADADINTDVVDDLKI